MQLLLLKRHDVPRIRPEQRRAITNQKSAKRQKLQCRRFSGGVDTRGCEKIIACESVWPARNYDCGEKAIRVPY